MQLKLLKHLKESRYNFIILTVALLNLFHSCILPFHCIVLLKLEWLMNFQVDCPFIVCMTYAFHTPDKLCFILDLMNGGDLHYHLSQHGVFNEHEMKFYAAEVILGEFRVVWLFLYIIVVYFLFSFTLLKRPSSISWSTNTHSSSNFFKTE